ncbi:hypothetical protein OAY10_03070 [Acidimicrobiaceae bacterium]|nr:hypothetical protein [Acidimicrobiaceae bacterium]
MQYFLVVKDCIFVLMEILEIIIDRELFSSKDIEDLGIVEDQCLKLVNFKNSSDLRIDDEVLENFDCVVTANELGSAIKKISDGKIVEHLNRENYKKLTYPLFLKSETFLKFLKENNSEWNLIKFLENHTFSINQI